MKRVKDSREPFIEKGDSEEKPYRIYLNGKVSTFSGLLGLDRVIGEVEYQQLLKTT